MGKKRCESEHLKNDKVGKFACKKCRLLADEKKKLCKPESVDLVNIKLNNS